jgi:hypothetical protein
MITKTTKTFLPIFKWLAINTCKDKLRPALMGIRVEYRNMADLTPDRPQEIFCEATDGFKIATATFKNNEGVNTDVLGLCPAGVYKPTFLSHNMIEWEEIPPEIEKFPDTTDLRTIKPRLKAPTPIEDYFSISTAFNPRLLVDFIPTFCPIVEFGFSGSFGLLYGSLSEDPGSNSGTINIDIEGIIMPMHTEHPHRFLVGPFLSSHIDVGYCFKIEQPTKQVVAVRELVEEPAVAEEPVVETEEPVLEQVGA